MERFRRLEEMSERTQGGGVGGNSETTGREHATLKSLVWNSSCVSQLNTPLQCWKRMPLFSPIPPCFFLEVITRGFMPRVVHDVDGLRDSGRASVKGNEPVTLPYFVNCRVARVPCSYLPNATACVGVFADEIRESTTMSEQHSHTERRLLD